MTTTPPSSRYTAFALIAAFAAVSLVVVLIFAMVPSKSDSATASAFTTVSNGTFPQQLLPIYVRADNGVRYALTGGRSMSGVRTVEIQSGTCVRINGGTPKCASGSWVTVPLGIGTFVVSRTR